MGPQTLQLHHSLTDVSFHYSHSIPSVKFNIHTPSLYLYDPVTLHEVDALIAYLLQVMCASLAEQLQAVIKQQHQKSNENCRQRVATFQQWKAEWVLLVAIYSPEAATVTILLKHQSAY